MASEVAQFGNNLLKSGAFLTKTDNQFIFFRQLGWTDNDDPRCGAAPAPRLAPASEL